MEVRPQESDFNFLVWDVEAARIPMPLAPYAQTNRLHHLTRLGVFRAVPIRPQLSVIHESGEAESHAIFGAYKLVEKGFVSQACVILRTRCSQNQAFACTWYGWQQFRRACLPPGRAHVDL